MDQHAVGATAKMGTGDFTESTRQIYDPLTGAVDGSGRTPFEGNIIPANRLDAAAKKLAGMTPLPNLGTGGISNNLFASAPPSSTARPWTRK